MAILRITEEKLLSKVLDLKRVPLRSIRPNPYLGRGHGPFDSFVSSLENDRSAKELYGEGEMATRNSVMFHKAPCLISASLYSSAYVCVIMWRFMAVRCAMHMKSPKYSFGCCDCRCSSTASERPYGQRCKFA
ncbi:hypothetical protein MPTK2_4g19085 [Marchantia polymorpha subsp. ruderalis]